MSGAENSGPKTRSMPTGPPKKSRYVSRAPGQSVSGGKGGGRGGEGLEVSNAHDVTWVRISAVEPDEVFAEPPSRTTIWHSRAFLHSLHR